VKNAEALLYPAGTEWRRKRRRDNSRREAADEKRQMESGRWKAAEKTAIQPRTKTTGTGSRKDVGKQ